MIDKNSIILGDCLEAMKDIPDGSVDAVITDLPFGSTRNPWDIVIPFDKLWEQWNRTAKDNAPFILFAQGIFYVDLVQSNRENFRYDLVWDKVLKSGFLNANVMPLRMHEQIAVFYRKKPTYNPQMEEGQPLHGSIARFPCSSRRGNANGSNMMSCPALLRSILSTKSSTFSGQRPCFRMRKADCGYPDRLRASA